MKIDYIKAFKDNYVWCIEENEDLIVIDPGESSGVLRYLERKKLRLESLLITHDHNDHVGGVSDLLKYANVPVYGMCPIATNPLKDKDLIVLSNNIQGKIIATPGHTNTSICYLLEINSKKHLFCGDTLFSAGCGRVFTGDFQAMFNSLNQLKNLDPDVLVYPGHEYTLQNLKFAQFLEPDNRLIKERIHQETIKMEKTGNTLPTTIKVEKQTNPFFRCDEIALVNALKKIVKKDITSEFECFVKLRELKNDY